jgi:hypothetical protein
MDVVDFLHANCDNCNISGLMMLMPDNDLAGFLFGFPWCINDYGRNDRVFVPVRAANVYFCSNLLHV